MSDESDEDWFESAIAEAEEAEKPEASEETEEGFEQVSTGLEQEQTDPADGFSAQEGDETELSEESAEAETADAPPWADAGDESVFEDEEFGSADETFAGESDETGPFGTDGEQAGTEGEPESPFGNSASDSFGGGDGGNLFDDEGFASAFEGGGGSEFEEEEFESDIPRIDLGIEGLDNMIQGGVPERHLMVTIGGAGTGKTTFGLQFLRHGLVQGESAVFITLEQSHDAIISTANEFGWDFEGFEAENRLAVVDLDPVEMANSLDNIQAELPQLVRDFGADRLVLDSVSLLEMMYDNQAKRRTEVFDFTRALKKAGVTTFLTSEASETNPYSSRHGIIEYLTDAVFVLQYVRGETQETRLAVEIQKIRNANHSREKKPYEMSESGLSVYQQANIF